MTEQPALLYPTQAIEHARLTYGAGALQVPRYLNPVPQ
jgi:hypothetical protein